MAKTRQRARLLTGVAGLDDILHGGLPKGHVYLIESDPDHVGNSVFARGRRE